MAKKIKARLKVCSRGHKFYKSSDCPVCPTCWSGYYRRRAQSDFPRTLAAPALRALLREKIVMLSQLTRYSEDQITALHGIGPGALEKLRRALRSKGLSFKK